MQFLNQEQAMIDLATLVSEIKQDPELEDAPVRMFEVNKNNFFC